MLILQTFCNLEVDKVKMESGRAKIRSWRSISLWIPPPLAVITLGRTRPVCDFFKQISKSRFVTKIQGYIWTSGKGSGAYLDI